jgi:hypothetical protein
VNLACGGTSRHAGGKSPRVHIDTGVWSEKKESIGLIESDGFFRRKEISSLLKKVYMIAIKGRLKWG